MIEIRNIHKSFGTLEVLRGNFDKARPHFQKAADAGLKEAVENLRELKRRLQ